MYARSNCSPPGFPPPKFEHQQGIKSLGVIDLFAFVFVNEAADDGHVEVSRGEGIGSEKVVVEHGAQLAAKPFADGDGEAHFLSLEDPGREVVGKGFAEHALGATLEELTLLPAGGIL